MVTVCIPGLSHANVKVLSKKFILAAPGTWLLAVTITSLISPSTSSMISFKKTTFCVPTFNLSPSNSDRSSLGASLIGLIAIVTIWSEYCSPSLALIVMVVSPFTSWSTVSKFSA